MTYEDILSLEVQLVGVDDALRKIAALEAEVPVVTVLAPPELPEPTELDAFEVPEIVASQPVRQSVAVELPAVQQPEVQLLGWGQQTVREAIRESVTVRERVVELPPTATKPRAPRRSTVEGALARWLGEALG